MITRSWKSSAWRKSYWVSINKSKSSRFTYIWLKWLSVNKHLSFRSAASEGNEEECLSFVVVDEFHEKFVPAVSSV